MIISGIDIYELRGINVNFLINKYKDMSLKNPIMKTFLEGLIEDLEISQKEWVEIENKEFKGLSMVRTDYYLKNKEKYKLKVKDI